jgi:hypothetical protein
VQTATAFADEKINKMLSHTEPSARAVCVKVVNKTIKAANIAACNFSFDIIFLLW